MDTNKLAIESIESNTVKQYLISINHKFSIREQISLLFNSDLELNRKLELFEYLLKSEDTPGNIKPEIEIVIGNINKFFNVLNDNENTALMFFDEYEDARTIKNLSKLADYIDNTNSTIWYDDILVIDLNTSNTKYRFSVTKDLNVTRYTEYDCTEYENNSLEFGYVDIPNEFNIGDLVKVIGLDEEYVVIQDSKLPEHLKYRSDFSDSFLTAVPKSVFSDSTVPYSKQIEDIVRNRIECIKNDNNFEDILSKRHEHLNITSIERVS